MNRLLKSMMLTLLGAILVQGSGHVTSIGIINPYTNNGDSALVEEAITHIKDKLHKIGGYDVSTQKRMITSYASFNKRFPTNCNEPRRAALLGQVLGLSRMIYGKVIYSDNHYAADLYMVDSESRKIISHISLEGEEGVALEDVMYASIGQLHEEDITDFTVNRYHGERVDKRKMMAISSGVWSAIGLGWGLATNESQDAHIEDVYSNWDAVKLSGINPAMSLVPKSARAKAMGNCYIAASKDAYGAFFNPAGAAWVDGPDASLNYQNRFGLVNAMSASYVDKATREMGWGHTIQYAGSDLYQEIDFSTIFSYKFIDLFNFLPPTSVGASVKIHSAQTTGGSGSPDDQEGTAFGGGLDIGFMTEVTKKIDGAIVFKNIPSFIRYNNVSSQYQYIEGFATEMQVGGLYEVTYNTLLICQFGVPLHHGQNWKYAGGLEQKLFSNFAIRLGAEKETFEVHELPWHLTSGLGINFPIKEKVIHIDAAYELNTSMELRDAWDVSFRFDL